MPKTNVINIRGKHKKNNNEISSLRSDISAACGGTRFRSRWSRYLEVTDGNQSAGAEEPLSVYSPNLTSINT